jgi:upstream activation factor subunit UAF30
VREILRAEALRQGWRLSESEVMEVFKLDIELNAQGLEAWLDSHSARARRIFPRKSVDISPPYRASSRHRSSCSGTKPVAYAPTIYRGEIEMAKKKAKKSSGKKRKPNAAFMKAMTPSGPLAAVIGSSAMPRTEVTKKIWGYIKRNGLQDKKNKRMINADDKLKPVFSGKSQVSMFEMTKLVSKHLK